MLTLRNLAFAFSYCSYTAQAAFSGGLYVVCNLKRYIKKRLHKERVVRLPNIPPVPSGADLVPSNRDLTTYVK